MQIQSEKISPESIMAHSYSEFSPAFDKNRALTIYNY